MKYLLRKGSDGLPLFWGPDGWAGNSHFAIRYPTQEAAERARELLGLDPEKVRVEERES